MKSELCIIIPCYNEAEKLLLENYRQFLSDTKGCTLVFSNDGSTDNTHKLLLGLKDEFDHQVFIVHNPVNSGKATAVQKGFQFAYDELEFDKIAYIDADLAVSLEETYEMRHLLTDEIGFVFGSRMLRVGSTIERKFHRFFIGRIIATLISRALRLKVYDTQCGCKLFNRNLGTVVIEDKFLSKWLFDVEIFFRLFKKLGKSKAIESMLEHPINEWIDRGASKVKFSYGFKVFFDLRKIKNKYRQYRY